MTKQDTQFIAQFSALYPQPFSISMSVAAAAILPLAKKHTRLVKRRKWAEVDAVRNEIRDVIALRCPRLRLEWVMDKPSVVVRFGKKHQNQLEVA